MNILFSTFLLINVLVSFHANSKCSGYKMHKLEEAGIFKYQNNLRSLNMFGYAKNLKKIKDQFKDTNKYSNGIWLRFGKRNQRISIEMES
jgi:hypothetical protein